MVDNLRRFVTTHWVDLNWALYDKLSSPKRVSLALLMLLLIAWVGLRKGSQIRRWTTRGAITSLLIYWLIIAPITASLLTHVLVSFVPADSGGKADAIVVLTRSEDVMGDRYEEAIELWKARRAPRLFVTSRENFELTQNLIQAQGYPTRIVSATDCARTTKDEATSTAAILGPQGIKTIILMTDTPHMLRAFLTFQGVGFSVIPRPVDLSPSLRAAKRSFLVVREYASLVSYALLGRLQPQTEAALAEPPTILLQSIRERGCDIESEQRIGKQVSRRLGDRHGAA